MGAQAIRCYATRIYPRAILFPKEMALINQSADSPTAAPVHIIPRADHPISRKDISSAALKVLYRLHEAGYQAFLVGGGIRDILLGLHPKDFDVATNATPEQVKSLFRNCRLIGRRFRLAHVMFGPETIEVATFRGDALFDGDDTDQTEHRRTDAAGRLLKDNIYGSIEQDVWRRDFTCNALYYNIADFSIWDFAEGLADIEARVLRLIGDPETRYREDPVRMLRAARFAAKLGFSLADETAQPIVHLNMLLANVPPARLFDEILKLMLSGYGEIALQSLVKLQLLEPLLPPVAEFLKQHADHPYARLLRLGLANTDARVVEDKPVSPVFLFLVLLIGPVEERTKRYMSEGAPWIRARERALDEILAEVLRRIGIPKRFTLPLREVFALVSRLRRTDGKRILQALSHPRFRMAYDVLVLEADVGLIDASVVEFWTIIQTLEAEDRLAFIKQQQQVQAGAVAEAGYIGDEGSSEDPLAQNDQRPKRRRRRGRSRRPASET